MLVFAVVLTAARKWTKYTLPVHTQSLKKAHYGINKRFFLNAREIKSDSENMKKDMIVLCRRRPISSMEEG